MVSTAANTIVSVFEDLSEARSAKQDLVASGFREQDIYISEEAGPASTGTRGYDEEHTGFWAGVRDMLGMTDAEYYEEASRRGNAVLTVNAGPEHLEQATTILERHRPLDLDRRAEEWRQSGWQPRQQPEQKAGQETVPLAEEELSVGKRAEQRGGVRIYRHVHEEPAEAGVRLREEHVDVSRRPADRPAEESAFQDETIEARGMQERPVVSKEARVKEELVVDKDAREREEKVRDTVRKTDVDVERLDRDDHPQP